VSELRPSSLKTCVFIEDPERPMLDDDDDVSVATVKPETAGGSQVGQMMATTCYIASSLPVSRRAS